MSLHINNLVKTFGTNIAVDGLSFSMENSGVYGLIGTNGAGKTTSIRCILGIMQSDSGTALWNGKKITRENLNFGYMPEERGIYVKCKVLEQLIYFGVLRGMNKTDSKKSAMKLLERLGIAEYANTVAEKLSKGNQQKVQLATTLIHDPQLIFLDEPFSGLDPLNTEILRSLINELIEKKKYIVLSSHQMATVEEYCESIVILNKGKSLLQGNLREIKRGYGHTNLIISSEYDVKQEAESFGLKCIDARADESEYKISSDKQANEFLAALVESKRFPTRFIIREPSLHEIFIEKVGEAK